jgi:hypothetical protein
MALIDLGRVAWAQGGCLLEIFGETRRADFVS